MTGPRVYIAAAGIISPLGSGLAATEEALRHNRSALAPLRIFPLLQGALLPVGQVDMAEDPSGPLPRTHLLARRAAAMAMTAETVPPDAVVIGSTTGGILATERLLRAGEVNPAAYRHHGLHSLAEDIAMGCGCTGPVIAISTACSSGAVALALALRLLRSGRATRVLAGGVDGLCRLTYFGFHALQLVDRDGCRPLDAGRRGMTVAEGAAMLLLTTRRPAEPLAELLGVGLSCDAFHPATPHPEGDGAFLAMRRALADAGLVPADIDYINLHGTATADNDLAEAKAVRRLFPVPPPLSSIKGATGHSLAAAGAIEAVVAALAVSRGLVPANTGCRQPDLALELHPQAEPALRPVDAVLSNSFGFGGNNGCLVITRPDRFPPVPASPGGDFLAVHGTACLSGAGDREATMAGLDQGDAVAGQVPAGPLAAGLDPRLTRRLKRLARMGLALARAARNDAGIDPAAVFMGTGWGALSETWDFLARLTESAEQFPSPTDFVGSVHNAPASQAAIFLGATGANITTSGGNGSFEQALLTADLFLGRQDGAALVLGADEGHEPFSRRLDPSVDENLPLADGGGALLVTRNRQGACCLARLAFLGSGEASGAVEAMVAALGGVAAIRTHCALLLAGVPAADSERGEAQLAQFLALAGTAVPVCRYRRHLGEFASVSAVAAIMAVSCLASARIPGLVAGGADIHLDGPRTILVLGTGTQLSAMEFSNP